MKRGTLTLLVAAISLLFVSGALGNELHPGLLQPAGTIDFSPAGAISSEKSPAEVDSSTCSRLGYAGDPYYYWFLPYGTTTAYAMRFSPGDTLQVDSLKAVEFYTYDPGDGSWGNDTIKVCVYADDGFGLPGTLIATKTVPPGSYVKYPDTTYVDFIPTKLLLAGDFHVGISSSAAVGSGRYECIVSDSGATGTARSSYQYEDAWYAFPRGGDEDYNFHIWVTTCYCPYWGVSGHKYRDNDHTKSITPGDLPLPGWEIQLWKDGALVCPAVQTGQQGEYSFFFYGTPPGTYYIREAISPSQKTAGWVQILPATVQATAQGGMGYYTVDFLNDSCYERTSQTYVAGTHDDFIGPEPSSPSQDLHDYMVINAPPCAVLEQFDKPAWDEWFGHTFSNLCGPKQLIVDARLCLHLKATSFQSTTDGLSLGDWKIGVSGGVWGIGLNALQSYATNGLDISWDEGDTMTVCLDLDELDLVPGGSGLPNIIASLQDGDLDILIQDDTEVDWLELIVTYCCDDCEVNSLDLSTGIDPTWGWLGPLEKDPDWIVGSAPVPGLTGPATVVNPYPGWLGPQQTSVWLTAKANPANALPASTAAGDYTFQYCFCAHLFANPRLTMGIRTDNEADFFLNSIPVVSTGNLSYSQQTPTTVNNWSTGFVEGGNVITARVYNDGAVVGLDVDGYVVANYPSLTTVECCSCFTDADINGDGHPLTVADMVYLYAFLMSSGPAPIPLYRADLNGDCIVDNLDYQTYQNYFIYGMSVFPTYPVRTCCCVTASLIKYPSKCGDVNGSDIVNIADVVYMISYIFSGGPAPDPLESGDVNENGIVNIADVVYLISYIFSGGPAPCASGRDDAGGKLLNDVVPEKATLTLIKSGQAEGTQKSLEVSVKSEGEIAGVQLEFKVDQTKAGKIDAKTTTRSEGLQVYSGIVDGLFKVGLVDVNGKNVIKAGEGSILVLTSQNAEVEFELVNTVLCDRSGREMEVTKEQSTPRATLPTEYSLDQNHPNPFNPSTEISFALPHAAQAQLVIYNIIGQKVTTLVDELLPAGWHSAIWDGTNAAGKPVSTGVYLYRLKTPDFAATRKMLLLK